jgi:hypothetical protein
MNGMAAGFAEYFDHWHITLPPDAIAHRKRGELSEQGWFIQYLFDTDENGDYVEFYAQHRMTNDRDVRIYDSGVTEDLPAYNYWVIFKAGATPEDHQRAQEENRQYNEAVEQDLQKKGFH